MNDDEERWSIAATLLVVVVLGAAIWALLFWMMWGLW